MKVLLIDTGNPVLTDIFKANKYEVFDASKLSSDAIFEMVNQYNGIILRSRIPIDKKFIDAATNLRFIGRIGAGMENIDVEYAEKNGVCCFNSPEGNRDAVGEHALGMLLCLLNNICRANVEVRNGLWQREWNRGVEIAGKTVGIIGYGNMGGAFARKISGFGAKVIAYDKYKKNYSDSFVVEAELELLFQHCDIVSLHVPLTNETEYMVNDTFLSCFKKPVILINTSRGKVVNTLSLVDAMKAGKVTGAALDVLEYEKKSLEGLSFEQLPESLKYLFGSDRVVFTPHVAGWTKESDVKLASCLAEKIIKHFSEK